MSAKLRFFLAGAATTIAIIAAGFGGGALFASSASKQGHPARIDRQATAPAARVALPATSEPIAPERVPAVGPTQEQAQLSQRPPQAQPVAQQEERPKTRQELREERRKLREERRAERRERRHHRWVSPQQEASGDGQFAPQ
ncbi:hypothetical protein JQ595_37800 [Bradyrhizobium japonicum]|uniref:hypothetical protein n=1 Tax=Bradyrhizobium japonicum TaxID=375 RepID=UPI001BA529DC|nr:hypothetical protein [Bradyrhizobium japonicum]MBR0734516.1 hypothetical protein [Bradyrhizobium japonicum]